MAVVERVRYFLDEHHAVYDTLPHREAFTAQGVAAASHVSGWQMAKVLVVRSERNGPVMVVLPVSCKLDLEALARLIGRPHLGLVQEKDLQILFPDCEAGAMPPFGHLYGIPVYVDSCFPRAKEILFQAGTRKEVVRMSYREFETLAKPVVADFCRH